MRGEKYSLDCMWAWSILFSVMFLVWATHVLLNDIFFKLPFFLSFIPELHLILCRLRVLSLYEEISFLLFFSSHLLSSEKKVWRERANKRDPNQGFILGDNDNLKAPALIYLSPNFSFRLQSSSYWLIHISWTPHGASASVIVVVIISFVLRKQKRRFSLSLSLFPVQWSFDEWTRTYLDFAFSFSCAEKSGDT